MDSTKNAIEANAGMSNVFPTINMENEFYGSESITKTLNEDQLSNVTSDTLEAQITLARCPRCADFSKPLISTTPNFISHFLAFILAVIGFPIIAFIPYIFGWVCCSNKIQKCQHCGNILFYKEADFVGVKSKLKGERQIK